jgi:hypothetical protein
MPEGRPPKYETEEQLIEVIQEYFNKCVPTPITIEGKDGEEHILTTKTGKPCLIPNPPTTAGLALHLGYASRQSLYDLKKKEEFSYTIKRAVLLIEDYHEKSIAIGENCTGSIFWLKNHNWKDKQEIKHTVNTEAYDKLKELYGHK